MHTKQICRGNIYFIIKAVARNLYGLLLIVIGLLCICGCATFRYPPVEKELFSWRIPKGQIITLKNTILNEGYERISKDNYRYEGAIATQYAKEILTAASKSRVQILLSFKETDAAADDYLNMGISIFSLERRARPEIIAEADRIEDILYEKLIKFAGKENVVRGKR
jgi:hypothetical protein